MSFQAMTAAVEVDAPSPSAKLLLLILANYADDDGSTFVSQATLVEDTGLSERAIRDNLVLCVQAGLILIEERRRDNGSRSSNRIALKFYEPKPRKQPAKSAGSDGESNRRNLLVAARQQPAESAGPEPIDSSVLTERPSSVEDTPQAVWNRAVNCLVAQGGETEAKARAYFGGILKLTGLKATDLADVVANAIRTGTGDPKSYLRAAAEAEAKRRRNGGEAVGAVSAWSDDRWGIALDVAAKRKAWPPEWGPKPGEPGSLVPDSLRDKAVQLGLCHGEG